MNELENKNFQEWMERIIEAERKVSVDPLLTEKVMMKLPGKPAKPQVQPFYVRLLPYFVKAACIAAALISGIYLGSLDTGTNTYQDNAGQLALHDGYIEGLDVLLNDK